MFQHIGYLAQPWWKTRKCVPCSVHTTYNKIVKRSSQHIRQQQVNFLFVIQVLTRNECRWAQNRQTNRRLKHRFCRVKNDHVMYVTYNIYIYLYIIRHIHTYIHTYIHIIYICIHTCMHTDTYIHTLMVPSVRYVLDMRKEESNLLAFVFYCVVISSVSVPLAASVATASFKSR